MLEIFDFFGGDVILQWEFPLVHTKGSSRSKLMAVPKIENLERETKFLHSVFNSC